MSPGLNINQGNKLQESLLPPQKMKQRRNELAVPHRIGICLCQRRNQLS